MTKEQRELDHKWHCCLNEYNKISGEFRHWMYEAKRAWEEAPRLQLLFKMERENKLTQIHKQCSMSKAEPVKDNHLSCCLGFECRKCEHLKAIEKTEATPERIDEIKAWTCLGHILQEVGNEKNNSFIDTSEGYLYTVDDKMFWSNVYQSMASNDPQEQKGE